MADKDPEWTVWEWKFNTLSGDERYVRVERRGRNEWRYKCTHHKSTCVIEGDTQWQPAYLVEERLKLGQWGLKLKTAPSYMMKWLRHDTDNNSPTKENKTMPCANNNPLADLLEGLQQGAIDGTKQAAVDAAGDALLEVATDILGKFNTESKLLDTKAGRAAAKVVMASVIAAVIDVLLPEHSDKVKEAARLQAQTATLDLLRPHLGTLRQLAQNLAGLGG